MRIRGKPGFYLDVDEDWCKLAGCCRLAHLEKKQLFWRHLPSGAALALMWYGMVSSLHETHLCDITFHLLFTSFEIAETVKWCRVAAVNCQHLMSLPAGLPSSSLILRWRCWGCIIRRGLSENVCLRRRRLTQRTITLRWLVFTS